MREEAINNVIHLMGKTFDENNEVGKLVAQFITNLMESKSALAMMSQTLQKSTEALMMNDAKGVASASMVLVTFGYLLRIEEEKEPVH